LVEVLIIIAVVVVVGTLFVMLPLLAGHSRVNARLAVCRKNMNSIGKAITTYTQDNGDYFPFAWGPAIGPGRGPMDGGGRIAPQDCTGCDASASLGLLYPQYLPSARVFRCPATEDTAAMTAKASLGACDGSNPQWVLGYTAPTWSSYGYDPRISPTALSNLAILADMDGTVAVDEDSSTQNHACGQHVLCVDGHVSWVKSNCVSNDPNDNIFAEAYKPANPTQGWHADTDAFMVRGSIALTSSYTYAEFKSLW